MSHIIQIPSFPHKKSVILLGQLNNEADRVNPAAVSIVSLLPSSSSGSVGGVINLTATISAVQPTGTSIGISTTNSLVLGVPSSVTVLAGNLTVNVPVNLNSAGTGTVTATLNGNVSSTVSASSVGEPSFTNQPAGGTVVINSDCSNLALFRSNYNNTFVVSDNDPLSPPWAFSQTLFAHNTSGGDELYWSTGSPQGYPGLFMGLWYRCNSAWQGRTVIDKLFFPRNLDVPSDGATNGVFGFLGGPTKGGPMFLVWGDNSGNTNPDFGDGVTGYPNVSSGALTAPGTWNKIEALVQCSTTETSRDGIVRWWINGTLAGNYQTVNYGKRAYGLNTWMWNETWDGSGDMGTINTVDWTHFFGHIYIVGYNTVLS